jgi:hypothetical protein
MISRSTSLISKLRLSSLLTTLWHHPHHLQGKGAIHEESFERLLQRLDFTETEYKRHPNGPMKWPDFHLFLGDQTQAIELKTTSKSTVCMGGTWPDPDCIYLITQMQAKQTLAQQKQKQKQQQNTPTIYIAKGSLLVPPTDRIHYENYKQSIQLVDRIQSSNWSLRARTEIRITLEKDKREEWYQTTLKQLMGE